MICPYCNNKIKDDSKKCRVCGVKLDKETDYNTVGLHQYFMSILYIVAIFAIVVSIVKFYEIKNLLAQAFIYLIGIAMILYICIKCGTFRLDINSKNTLESIKNNFIYYTRILFLIAITLVTGYLLVICILAQAVASVLILLVLLMCFIFLLYKEYKNTHVKETKKRGK